ncbi:MAG: ABC transporter permease [Clostridia bacterium]|nr:ABC transporter permease [Clostridia bacterium]
MAKGLLSKNKIKANGLQFHKSIVIMWAMVKKNIKNQYRRSVLGILWTVLNPLLTMLVMAFVFSSIFGRNNINMDYPVYVLSGNIVFSLMRTATVTALPCMVNNYDLLTKTRVPYFVFPASNVVSSLVNFGFSLIALIVVMLIRLPQGVEFHWTLLMIIVWLPAIFFFSLGLALALCSIYVRFRDIKHLYNVFLTLWMYLTPVFYALETLHNEKVQKVLIANPMVHYLSYFRDLIMGIVPSWQTHLIIYGVGFLSLAIGWFIFRSQRKSFIIYI